ncbi:MAG: type IV toxin-antitoxin system AbiEi family antitoxin [Sporichthyaceae bacterium]
MAPRPFVPPEFTSGPFSRSTALAAGLSDRQLRSQCWVRLLPNVYIHASVVLTDDQRLTALRLAAPADAVVTGVTAAWLYGVWQPRPGQPVPMELGVPRTPSRSAAAAGIRRLVVDPIDINELNGIPVTSPERTCFQLMARTSLVEAVVVADAFSHAGLATQRGLMRFADERPHWPHVRKARLAVDLARHEAASPMESRLRMVIVLNGLPEPPVLNGGLYDEDGRLLGIPDMLYLGPFFGIEYDGGYHLTPEQLARDHVRENRLLVGGVPLLRYTSIDVFARPERIVREVADMLGARGLRIAA